jgi:flavodoxin
VARETIRAQRWCAVPRRLSEPTRRTVIGAAGIAALTYMAGCTPSDERGPKTSQDPTPEGTSDMSSSAERSTEARPLLVFFSRPGENYWEGGRRDLEIGNTKVIAQMIDEQIDCDVHEIIAADPYPHAYDPTVERNQQEQRDDARPEIAGELPDLTSYQTVLLGSPVWNTRAPMIMRTFLDSTDALAGKTIRPFLTYAVGAGSVFDDYAEFCPDATVETGLAIRGEDAADSAAEVEQWLQAAGLG